MADYYSDKHFEGDKHKGHRARVRSRIQKNGLEALLDYEKLEALLFWPISRKDTKDLAVELIRRFGSLNGVLDADENELEDVPNIGESTIFFIKCLKQVAEIYMRNRVKRENNFRDSAVVEKYLYECLSCEKVERLFVFYLDNNYDVITQDIFDSGDSNKINIDSSTLIHKAAVLRAKMIVLAHNHPFGLPIPSQDDLNFTESVDESANAIGVRLLQHYIVSEGKCVPIMG